MVPVCIAKLARVLGSWREYSNSSIARRIGSERAVVHLNRCLLRKCLTGWHEYHQLALKKMVSKSQNILPENVKFFSCVVALKTLCTF